MIIWAIWVACAVMSSRQIVRTMRAGAKADFVNKPLPILLSRRPLDTSVRPTFVFGPHDFIVVASTLLSFLRTCRNEESFQVWRFVGIEGRTTSSPFVLSSGNWNIKTSRSFRPATAFKLDPTPVVSRKWTFEQMYGSFLHSSLRLHLYLHKYPPSHVFIAFIPGRIT
jgi:hypothetical protein